MTVDDFMNALCERIGRYYRLSHSASHPQDRAVWRAWAEWEQGHYDRICFHLGVFNDPRTRT